MKRSRIPPKKSRRLFKKTANRMHKKNRPGVMRGGMRL